MVTVEQGQNMLDVALQHCGNTSAAFAIAKLNGLSLTDDLIAGSSLIIPDVVEPAMVQYLSDNNIVPATGTSLIGEVEAPGGIDYMAIEVDFIVS
jgi:hypothetical protein